MTDLEFFRKSAEECRRLAARARTETARRELLLWAREFEAVAAGRDPLPFAGAEVQDASD